MKFISTRNTAAEISAADAVAEGVAADGGMFVPQEFPLLAYQKLCPMDLAARTDTVLRMFFDFAEPNTAEWTEMTFADCDDPAPIVKLDDGAFMLELYHGATGSSCDIAAAAFPHLLDMAKKERGDSKRSLVLVAGSGAECIAISNAFLRSGGKTVCGFYPSDEVGEYNKRVLNSCDHAVPISGNSDEIHAAVRAAYSDDGLSAALNADNLELHTADTANIAAIVSQIAYFYSAYCDLINDGEIKAEEKVDFIIPTVDFGNVLAGYYALRMGLPINKLVCVSDTDGAPANFLATGLYDVNRITSCDERAFANARAACNLERLIFEASGRNAELTSARIGELYGSGRFEVTESEMEKIRAVIATDGADSAHARDAMSELFDEYGYIVDPHTAAAYAVAVRREFIHPTVTVCTEHPFKYARDILFALGESTKGSPSDLIARLEDVTAMDAPIAVKNTLSAACGDKTELPPSEIENCILRFGKKELKL